jgi:endonuclease G
MKRRKFLVGIVIIISASILWIYVSKYKTGSAELPELVLKISDVSEGYPADNISDTILRYTGFTLSYNEKYEQPAWVAYILTRSEVLSGNEVRTENFRPDKNISTGSATLKDYQGSGFDRGHMAPAADMKWSAKAMSESFLMSNMSPQEQGFNRGIWNRLEARVREWAVENDSILVVSGPVLKGIKKYIGKDSVGVPYYYFKVIADISSPTYKVISFVLPNKSSNKEILDYVVTVDSVERITGYTFFPSVQDNQMRKRLKTTLSTSSWK